MATDTPTEPVTHWVRAFPESKSAERRGFHCGAMFNPRAATSYREQVTCEPCIKAALLQAFLVARSRPALSDSEASIVLAFMDVMEAKRLQGDLHGWRVTRDPKGCIVEIQTVEGYGFTGEGVSFDAARLNLSHQLIAAGLKGAGSA